MQFVNVTFARALSITGVVEPTRPAHSPSTRRAVLLRTVACVVAFGHQLRGAVSQKVESGLPARPQPLSLGLLYTLLAARIGTTVCLVTDNIRNRTQTSVIANCLWLSNSGLAFLSALAVGAPAAIYGAIALSGVAQVYGAVKCNNTSGQQGHKKRAEIHPLVKLSVGLCCCGFALLLADIGAKIGLVSPIKYATADLALITSGVIWPLSVIPLIFKLSKESPQPNARKRLVMGCWSINSLITIANAANTFLAHSAVSAKIAAVCPILSVLTVTFVYWRHFNKLK